MAGLNLMSPTTAVKAIFVLGGEVERDLYAVQLGEEVPGTLVFVSSPGGGAEERLRSLELASRLRLSWDATDTVTNFSTVIPSLIRAGVTHVLLVTSPYHMPRSRAIASVMLGAVGITFERRPVVGGLEIPVEPHWKTWRDCLRAWLWRLTGWDLRVASRVAKELDAVAVLAIAASLVLGIGLLLALSRRAGWRRVRAAPSAGASAVNASAMSYSVAGAPLAVLVGCFCRRMCSTRAKYLRPTAHDVDV